MSKIHNLIKVAFAALQGKTFSLPISNWDTNVVDFVVDLDYNKNTHIVCQTIAKLPDVLAEETKGAHQITFVRYKRDGFGFSQGYPSFCHTSKVIGTTKSLEDLCREDTLFYIQSVETEKGRAACRLCPFTEIDEEICNFLLPFVKETVIKICHSKAIDNYYETERQREEQEKQKKLADLGIHQVQKIVLDERSSYGGRKEYKFLFSTPVDKETFIKFLDIEGLPTEVHKIDAPICQETVAYYPTVGGWVYKWLGSYTD